MSCGADTKANELLDVLLEGKKFPFPDIDLDSDEYKLPTTEGNPLYNAVTELTNEDLTTGIVGGTGTFDALMSSIGSHLKREMEANRISGAEYTKAYIELTAAALATATQFLLGKDQAYWQAVTAQMQARMAEAQVVTARVNLESAKVQMQTVKYESLTAEANYGLTKIRIATEDVNYCVAQYNLENTLPADLLIKTRQEDNLRIEGVVAQYNLDNVLPAQLAREQQQIANLIIEGDIGKYNLSTLLPAQARLLGEQTEVQRAQTLDVRSDGNVISGVLGKQKNLLDQQKTSYIRDSEVKAAKLISDAWITQKTMDDGLIPPEVFANPSVNTTITRIRENNGLT